MTTTASAGPILLLPMLCLPKLLNCMLSFLSTMSGFGLSRGQISALKVGNQPINGRFCTGIGPIFLAERNQGTILVRPREMKHWLGAIYDQGLLQWIYKKDQQCFKWYVSQTYSRVLPKKTVALPYSVILPCCLFWPDFPLRFNLALLLDEFCPLTA